MGVLSFIPIIGKALEKGLSVVDKLVQDKDLAEQLKSEIKSQVLVQEHDQMIKELESQTQIILAEAKGGWLQRNWRPMLMALFGIIIANNYILNPWLNAMFGIDIIMEIPENMWQLLKLGIGGYIVSRGAEKSIGIYKGKRNT